MDITTIGLDLAKSIFQVHGIDALGRIVVRKTLRRSRVLPLFAKRPSCLVGIAAWATMVRGGTCTARRHRGFSPHKVFHEVARAM